MEDADIITYVKQGNAGLYSLLVEKYHRSVLNFVFRILRDPAVVEDIGQEVFLSAFASLRSFDERRGVAFSTWLFTIARNRSLTELRRLKREVQVGLPDLDEFPSQEAPVERIVIDREEAELMAEAIRGLPEPFRTTLAETLQGKPMDEMARKGGISPQTVRSRLSRAREMLREYFRRCFREVDQ